MDDILTVSQLIEELGELPPDAPVMITIIKYPDEFRIKADAEGQGRWDLGTDVECHPLERGEITMQDGLAYLTVELTDYDESRRTHLKG